MRTKISPDTLARTIVLALALLNQLLIVVGKSPIPVAEDDIYQVVSVVATIATAVIAWWYNNDFTQAAMRGTALAKRLKEEKKNG